MSNEFVNDGTSPAGRLLAVCNRALSVKAEMSETAVSVFSQVFLPNSGSRNDTHKIGRYLLLCHSQLKIVEKIAQEKGIPRKLYSSALGGLGAFFSPVAKDTSWSSVRGLAPVPVMETLMWLAWGMQNYDSGGSLQDAEALDQELKELLSVLRAHSGEDVKLDDLMKRVERIREAVVNAEITGVDESLGIVKDELFSIVLDAEDIKVRIDHINDQTLSDKLGSGCRTLLEYLKESGKYTDPVNKIVTLVGSAGKLLGMG